MKSTCKQIQETLALEGPQAFREDERAQKHLEECEACFKFLETLGELDASLRVLPAVDAPDTLVKQLLARPELMEKETAKAPLLEKPTHQAIGFNWFRWAAVGAAAVVVLYIVMIPGLYQAQRSPEIADKLESEWRDYKRQNPAPTDERAREIYEDESRFQYARPNELAAAQVRRARRPARGRKIFWRSRRRRGRRSGRCFGWNRGWIPDAPASPEPPKKSADLDRNIGQEEIIAMIGIRI